MAHIPFLLEPKFNINPVLQQTFRLPPVRSFSINLSSANNNAFSLNYSSVIRYSPKLRTKCFSMGPKPKGENGSGGNGGREDNDLKAVAINSGINEVLWRSITIALIALQKSVITGVLLGSLLLYDHQRRCIALAASGGRMGGSSFSSSSSKSSKSSSSTSSSKSSSHSSSSSKSRPSYSSSSKSRPSYSSSSSSNRPSYSSSSSSKSKSPSYSSSSSTSSSKSPSYSSSWSTSSSESPSYSSPWSTSSSESPPFSSSSSRSSSTRPKSSSSSSQPSTPSLGGELEPEVKVEPAVAVEPAVEVEPAVAVKPAVEGESAVGVAPAVVVKPAFGAGPIAACAMIVVALGLAPEILSRTLFAKKTSVLKLQVGLSATVRSMQRDLNRIAETADTSSPQGLHYILQETTRALLRYPDSYISGFSSVDAKKSIVEVEKLFNQLCIEERGKFDEETLVNVNNIRKQSATTQKSNDVGHEFIVITIVVAADGVHKLPPIKSSAKLKEALQKLTTIPSSGIKAVEVLWTPQNENDILTKQEYLKDYSMLHPL